MKTTAMHLTARLLVIPTLALLTLFTACTATEPSAQPAVGAKSVLSYPITRTGTVVDNYHGTEIADPYRWLEDDVRESSAVADWVTQQSDLSLNYLNNLPGRASIGERMTSLWDYERASSPRLRGGRYWYSHNDGLANQYRVYAADTATAQGDVMLDPNTWSEDGTVALAGYWPDPTGTRIAYTIQDGGTDWRIAKVRNIKSGEDESDDLRWLKFTGVYWAADGSGFYYSRYPAPAAGKKFQSTNLNKAVYFHTIGEPQASDKLIFATPDHPDYGFWLDITDDGSFLVISNSIGTDDRYQMYVQDLRTPNNPIRQIVEGFDNDYSLIGNKGSVLLFRSNLDAENGAVLAFDLSKTSTGMPAPSVVVAERKDTLLGGSLVDNTLILHYLNDAASKVALIDATTGSERTLKLPGIGSVSGFPNNHKGAETFYKFSSMSTPGTTYRLDVNTGESTVIRQPKVTFDPADYQVSRAFYASKDGTRVPLFIAAKKTTQLSNAPTLLYGYGGFNISLTPGFSVKNLAWMELGGVYVQANLRGGGEYGNAWHKAGTKLQKQNVFDDFIAAAEYLIEEGITTPARLGVHGRSNGGLLVGAVVNQRPDLFGAALPGVGVMDMLRFHRFTAGRFWTDDYGSADNADEFAALYAYSPYHNIGSGKNYPPVLITTADTDDRVVPGHSFKYAAALQAADTGSAPKLLRVETRSGHGAGKPTSKVIAEFADMWAFLAYHLGLNVGS